MTGNHLRTVDLHVHTAFSSFRHLKSLRDYVAITDHDTIDGAFRSERQASRLLLSDGR